MRTPLQCLFALMLPCAALRAQQTADEVIAKYAERIGGLEHIHGIQSVRRTGKFYGGGGFEARIVY